MEQKLLSKWLKFIIIGVGICGIIIYAIVFPITGQMVVKQYEEVKAYFLPWLLFIWATGIPCYIALVFAWKIATNIGDDHSFSKINAKLLKWISMLAVGDAAFFLGGNLLFLILNMNHPSVVLISFIIVFVGIAVAVASAGLTHLVLKAAVLQEQSDLTI